MTNTNEIREALALAEAQVQKEKDELIAVQVRLQKAREQVTHLIGEFHTAIDQEAKRATARDRAAAKRIAKKYSIDIENDSVWDIDGYDFRTWVSCPEWLEGDDPLEDGHYAYDWADTRWLVEFYAKHHPTHPKHSEREFLTHSPWC